MEQPADRGGGEASMVAPFDERERTFVIELMRRLVNVHAAPPRAAVAQE